MRENIERDFDTYNLIKQRSVDELS